ncbi:MAG: EamA family transporter [Candidatus Hodarchaeales archaeon]|jgi:drug/metabolite transporter (DMT)-like permease
MLEESVIIAAFAATCLFSVSTVFSKFLISDLKNPFKLLRLQLLLNLLIAFILLIISYLTGIDVFKNITLVTILLIGFSGVFIFGGLLLFYFGLIVGNTSVAGVITSSRVILSVLFGLFIFGEILPLNAYILIFVIVSGVFLVSWSSDISIKDIVLFRANGSGIFASSVTLWAIGNIFIRLLNNSVNVPMMLVIRLFLMSLISVLTYPLFIRFTLRKRNIPTDEKITKMFVGKMVTYLIGFTLADIFITYALGESLALTETIVALQSVFIFLIVLVLSFNMKFRKILDEGLERKVIIIRGLGVLISLTGTILLMSYTLVV